MIQNRAHHDPACFQTTGRERLPSPISINRKMLCDECKRPFETRVDWQTTCNSCLVRPSKAYNQECLTSGTASDGSAKITTPGSDANAAAQRPAAEGLLKFSLPIIKKGSRPMPPVLNGTTKKKEENTMEGLKPKICVDCKEEYTPTSNVQKRCPKCKEIYKPVAPPRKEHAEVAPQVSHALAPGKGVVCRLSGRPRAQSSSRISTGC